jgi:Skp family chaperone for outer membrane proteins
MVSRFLAMALACLLLSAPMTEAIAAAPNVAIVDADKILSESKAAKSLQSQIKLKKETFQKEFSAKEKELKKTETDLLSQRETLSAEDFASKRKAYEAQILETRKLFQKRRNALDTGLSKAMESLRKNIIEAAAKIADEKGFDIVLTRDSVLIAEKSLDITDEVLGALDAQITSIPLQVE